MPRRRRARRAGRSRNRSRWSTAGWTRWASSAEDSVEQIEQRRPESAREPRLRRLGRDGRAARRQIFVGRPEAELGEQVDAAALRDQARDFAVWVGEVPEMACARRTGGDAGGLPLGGRQILIVDSIDAERALAHHAGCLVELPRAIRTGPGAELATDADVGIDEYDAVLRALVGRSCRADRHAQGIFAMHAGAGEVHRPGAPRALRLVRVDAIEPNTVRIRAVPVVVGQEAGLSAGVPLLAVDRAGMAADAGVEIHHQPQLLRPRWGLRQHRHDALSAVSLMRNGLAPGRGAVSAGDC